MDNIKFKSEQLNEYLKKELNKDEFTVEDIKKLSRISVNGAKDASREDIEKLLSLNIDNLTFENLDFGNYEFNNVNCKTLGFSNCNLEQAKFNENVNCEEIALLTNNIISGYNTKTLKISKECLETLKNVSTLKKLTLENLENVEIPKIETLEEISVYSIDDLKLIKNLTQVKKLWLTNYKGIDDNKEIKNIEILKEFNNLQELLIDNVKEAKDNLPTAKNLRSIDLENCEIVDSDLGNFARNYENLEKVGLSENKIKDLEELNKFARRVKVTSIEGNPVAEKLKEQRIAVADLPEDGNQRTMLDIWKDMQYRRWDEFRFEIQNKEELEALTNLGMIDECSGMATEIDLKDMEGMSEQEIESIAKMEDVVLKVGSFRGMTKEKLSQLENVKFLVKDDTYASQSFLVSEGKYYSKDNMNDYLEIFDAIKDSTPEGASDLEKFLAAYKAIGMYADYDRSGCIGKEEYIEGNETLTRSLEGLKQGRLVCYGYALALNYALDYLGVESKMIGGTGKRDEPGNEHAWNQVKLEGKWYNTDLTFDYDRIRDNEPLVNTLKSDEEFYKNHFPKEKVHKCEESYPQEEIINGIKNQKETDLDKFNREKGKEREGEKVNKENLKEREVREEDLEKISREVVIEQGVVGKIREMAETDRNQSQR